MMNDQRETNQSIQVCENPECKYSGLYISSQKPSVYIREDGKEDFELLRYFWKGRFYCEECVVREIVTPLDDTATGSDPP